MTHPTDRVQDEDLLYAWSEEELSAEEAMRLRRLLADDPELRQEREAIEDLRDEVRSLPRGVEPDRDLWPELKARLEDEPRGGRGRILPFRLPPSSPAARWATALAAVLVVAVGLALALQMESPAATGAGAALAASEAEYVNARRAVLAQLEEPGPAWSTEVMAVVNVNLEVVDRSVREVEADLARNADDPHLRLVLADRYRSQAELLRNLQRRTAGI